MRRLLTVSALLASSLHLTVSGQQALQPNEFKVGIYGANIAESYINNSCKVTYETPTHDGKNTSVLNVLAEDGFNIYQTYGPNEWQSEEWIKTFLKLTDANGLEAELGLYQWYKPAVDAQNNYLGYGDNTYDNCGRPIDPCDWPALRDHFRRDHDNLIQNVYTQSPYKDIIWGYHVAEESAYFHEFQHTDDCSGWDVNDPTNFSYVEIPPTNVSQALTHFKYELNNNGVNTHKLVTGEAHHGKTVWAGSNDGQGQYNPQDYIPLLNPADPLDVYFEMSYYQFPSATWATEDISRLYQDKKHYLGGMLSVDYALEHTPQVHNAIGGAGTLEHPNFWAHYHSDQSIENANWLWWQTYNSIIHGVQGVWFYDLNIMWSTGETKSWKPSNTDPDRFDRSYFPKNYNDFVGPLAKELRYLINNNIVSTDPNTVIATKKDEVDPLCIVPAAATYIPNTLNPDKITEEYGLRYTIRTNGTDVYMIVTNGLPVEITTTLDFSSTGNPVIQNSTGVEVLFDDNSLAPSSPDYKTIRNSSIDLAANTVGSTHQLNYTTNQNLALTFGPLDTKVFKFISTPPNHNNDWEQVWSNFGSGKIKGHEVNDFDLFHPGDFDGDGTDELLCVQNTGTNNDWITILKYINGDWTWHWSNYGSPTGLDLYPYRANLTVGDFDGDGKDELLGRQAPNIAAMFEFNNGSWQEDVSTNGNPINLGYASTPFYVGDFNGDGKDEIMAKYQSTGFSIMYGIWQNNFTNLWMYSNAHPISVYLDNAVVGDFDGDNKDEILGFSSWSTLFHYENGTWNWGWSTYGANSIGGWGYPLLNTDQVITGNLDGDVKDEMVLLQAHPNAAWATSMDLQGNWNANWSANPNSVPFIDDWSLASQGGSNTQYFAIKPVANEPHHILAMRKFCNQYTVSMYKPTGTGNYKKPEIEAPLAIEEPAAVKIFPNPSAGQVQVAAQSGTIRSIQVVDLSGKSMHVQDFSIPTASAALDLSELSNGIYMVTISCTDGQIIREKLILTQ